MTADIRRCTVSDRPTKYDNSKHKALIAELVASGAVTHRFAERTATAIAGQCRNQLCTEAECEEFLAEGPHCCCDRCFIRTDMVACRLIPDAHRIDIDARVVTAYEVEVTFAVNEDKLELYRHWWYMVDEFHWALRLVIVNRFGQQNEVNISPFAAPAPALDGSSGLTAGVL
jgi:hypothetical protein